MKIKGKKYGWLALVLCLCVFFSSVGVLAAENPPGSTSAQSGSTSETWDPISTSKTATPLQDNFSDITLTVGRASTSYDIVFVMDNTTCKDDVTEAMMSMLNELYQRIQQVNTDAQVKVGGVKFKGSANTADFPLTPLSSLEEDSWTDYIRNQPATGSGTNMHAGLVSAYNMLTADTAVPDQNKFVILISDGVTYLWNHDVENVPTTHGINYYEPSGALTYAIPSVWEAKYGVGYVPSNWQDHLDWVAENLDASLAYASVYDRSNFKGKPAIHYSEPGTQNLVTSVDVSLYRCYQVWSQLEKMGCQTFAMTIQDNNYPFATPFIASVLNHGNTLSIGGILNTVMDRIVYNVVAAGSVVKDYMGNSDATDGNSYRFHFVNDLTTLSARIGSQTLTKEKIGDNHYGFGKQSDGSYQFELTYYPNSTDGEHLEWTIHIPVKSLLPVSLTYRVELTPPTAVGNHSLYPNTKAVLTAKDTNGNDAQRIFQRPVIPYTVEKKTVSVTVSKTWLDGDNFANIRPNEITVRLVADGKDTGKTLTLSESNGWKATFTDLDEEQNGTPIRYTVREEDVQGYDASYTADASNGYTIENRIRYVPPTGVILDSAPWRIGGMAALLGLGVLLLERRKRYR